MRLNLQETAICSHFLVTLTFLGSDFNEVLISEYLEAIQSGVQNS